MKSTEFVKNISPLAIFQPPKKFWLNVCSNRIEIFWLKYVIVIFQVQKEDLMKKFAEMEDKLKQQETEHAEKIYNLERKAVVDKDR